MGMTVSRRAALLGPLALLPVVVARGMDARAADGTLAALQALEARHGGRLGVAVLDTATGARIDHRADERFPMCSTFKFLAAAFVLARVDRGEEGLERQVAISRSDLVTRDGRVGWSPVTEPRAGTAMSVAEPCAAAVTMSDNSAANLLLRSFGGPAALTQFARSLGDEVTRLDRMEPDLNEAVPGDPRDTTSPAAMLGTMRRLLDGDTLTPASRAHLTAWMVATDTGSRRLRAGLPADWRAGDKTGGTHGVANDIAVAWPPGRAPMLITAYYAEFSGTDEQRDAVLADVARIAVR